MADIITFDPNKKKLQPVGALEKKWALKPGDDELAGTFKALMYSLAKADEMAAEARERAANESRNARECEYSIAAGEYEGVRGYFTRYMKYGRDICIRFSKAYDKGGASRKYLDRTGRAPKVPWKKIDAGEVWSGEGILAEYFVSRIEDNWQNDCLYFDFSEMDRSKFSDPIAEMRREHRKAKTRRKVRPVRTMA